MAPHAQPVCPRSRGPDGNPRGRCHGRARGADPDVRAPRPHGRHPHGDCRGPSERSAPARPSIAEAQPLLPATTAAPSQTAPELPRSGVASTDTPFAELILESAAGAGAAPAVHPKTDEPTTPATPHYDNLLLAPTVIVPAADEEENRRFKVLAAEEVSDFRMAIFNRAGRQVFSTQNIDQAWDATHDGTLVPQGAYVWVARYRDSEGHPRSEKGTVVVVR